MLVICLLNNIVLRGRGFCTSSIAQITGNVPRLLADIVVPRESSSSWASQIVNSLLLAGLLSGKGRAMALQFPSCGVYFDDNL